MMLDRIRKVLARDKSSEAKSAITLSRSAFETADSLIAEGNTAETAGNLEAACERYRSAVRIAPQYAKAHLNFGIALEASGAADEARGSYEAALAIEPGETYANYNLGRHHFLRSA